MYTCLKGITVCVTVWAGRMTSHQLTKTSMKYRSNKRPFFQEICNNVCKTCDTELGHHIYVCITGFQWLDNTLPLILKIGNKWSPRLQKNQLYCCVIINVRWAPIGCQYRKLFNCNREASGEWQNYYPTYTWCWPIWKTDCVLEYVPFSTNLLVKRH